LYFAFPLSYRDVQKLLLYRGIDVSHEAIRAWGKKLGQQFASEIRRCRRRAADKWHLDEMVITINGEQYYLWRAVDAPG
jgi:putative transposase